MNEKLFSLDDFLKVACFILAILVAIVGVWLYLVFRKARRQEMENMLRSLGTTTTHATFKLVRHRRQDQIIV